MSTLSDIILSTSTGGETKLQEASEIQAQTYFSFMVNSLQSWILYTSLQIRKATMLFD